MEKQALVDTMKKLYQLDDAGWRHLLFENESFHQLVKSILFSPDEEVQHIGHVIFAGGELLLKTLEYHYDDQPLWAQAELDHLIQRYKRLLERQTKLHKQRVFRHVVLALEEQNRLYIKINRERTPPQPSHRRRGADYKTYLETLNHKGQSIQMVKDPSLRRFRN